MEKDWARSSQMSVPAHTTAYLLNLPPLPQPQSNSSAGSSQPLIPDMPTYVGRASLCTNLNFSWEQVSLVWESNRLFSTSLFYIWVYTPPVSCTLALAYISYLWPWDAAKFQSCPLSKCLYNYSVTFDFKIWSRNDKKLKVAKVLMLVFVSETSGNPAVC